MVLGDARGWCPWRCRFALARGIMLPSPRQARVPSESSVVDDEQRHTAEPRPRQRDRSPSRGSGSAKRRLKRHPSAPSSGAEAAGRWIRVPSKRQVATSRGDPVSLAAAIARRNSSWGKQRAPKQPVPEHQLLHSGSDAPHHRRFALVAPRRPLKPSTRNNSGYQPTATEATAAASWSKKTPVAPCSDDEDHQDADSAVAAASSLPQRRRRRRRRNMTAAKQRDASSLDSNNPSSEAAAAPTPDQLSGESLSTHTPQAVEHSRLTLIVRPFVKCTDGQRTSIHSLHDILHRESGVDYALEADTPLVQPRDAPAAVVPPMLLLSDPLGDCSVATGQPDDFEDDQSRPRGYGHLAMPPTAFTVEGIATPNTFYSLVCPPLPPPIPQRRTYQDILAQFDATNGSFSWHGDASATADFAHQLELLCHDAAAMLRQQRLLRRLDAPAYVLGDIHGNFADLHFFLRNFLVMNDLSLTPCQILCLGDYVDRGPHSVECVALLFALFIEAPERVVLLRGNHEDRIVCGDRRVYGEDCFWAQCCRRFGTESGTRLFRIVTRVFRYLPLACELRFPEAGAPRVLCTHGGFPRFTLGDESSFEKIKLLERDDFPRFLTLFPNNPLALDDSGSESDLPDFVEVAWFTAFDVLWSDPTSDADDAAIDVNGFTCNSRGMNVLSFSQRAVEYYLRATGYAMLFRAHQEKRFGLRLSKSSKVLTLFSSSNYQGHGNSAGCAVVSANGCVQLVVKH